MAASSFLDTQHLGGHDSRQRFAQNHIHVALTLYGVEKPVYDFSNVERKTATRPG